MSDPFDAPAGEPAPATPESLESNATLSAMLGVTAMACNMVAPCGCWFPAVFGVVLGGAAFMTARTVQANMPEGKAQAYSNVGLATGAIAAVWSALVLIGFVMYIMLYALILVAAVLGEL